MHGGVLMQFKRKIIFHGSRLSPLQQRVLSIELCGNDMDAESVYGPSPTLMVWVAHMLHAQNFLDDTQWRLLLSECSHYIGAVSDAIARHLQHQEPYQDGMALPQLVFCDGRYVTWPSLAMRGHLDLETGERVEVIPPPVITVAYHLDALAARELRRCTALERRDAATADAGKQG